MGMDYNAESNNEFNQLIYEEAQTCLKCKQLDCDDNSYVTLSEDHDLQFHMGPAKDSCVKMDADQELGQASSMMTRGKASKCHCQKSLPSVLTEDRVWSKIIMPAFLVWAGSSDPWMISDDKLMQSLQTIITATFPDFLNLDKIFPGMPMFTIWRSNFGSTAITVISHFLVSDLNSAVPSPPEACTSPNTLKLTFEDLKRTGIQGALALTCTALHHTLTLYNEGMLDLNAMVAPRKAKMPLKMNKATGKESSTVWMFSEQNCSSHTRQYADAIAKHDDATLCEILVGATILTLGSKQVISEEGTVQSEEKDTAALLIANLCKAYHCLCTLLTAS
ncbi:hypothetical protein EDC04DRAFT_2774939 [Pisolithus marmoratus]|nr:hypothetical protein EDC04DRAFT_2774939 [Pisolithus marmoratus]